MKKEHTEEKNQKGAKEQASSTALQGRRPEEQATPAFGSSFRFMRRFAEDMERLFEDLGGGRVTQFFEHELKPLRKELGAEWSPQVEVLQTDGQLTVRADLPGLTKDNVKVEVTDEALTISGERRQEEKEEREGYYRSERHYGSFYRHIPLPEGVDTKHATATFRNGVLEVLMKAPKTEPHVRRLEIKGVEENAEEGVRAHAAAK